MVFFIFIAAIAAYYVWKARNKAAETEMRLFAIDMERERQYHKIFQSYEHKLRSDRVRFGQIYEQIIPFAKIFPFNSKDCRFLGSPIDYVVFDGLDDGNVKEIVFIEVKSGINSDMSKREKLVAKAVEEGKVRFMRISSNG